MTLLHSFVSEARVLRQARLRTSARRSARVRRGLCEQEPGRPAIAAAGLRSVRNYPTERIKRLTPSPPSTRASAPAPSG